MLSSTLDRSRRFHPFSRLSPFFIDMPSLADALMEVDHALDDDHGHRRDRSQQQRAILVDVKETEKGVEVHADLPGLKKEEISVDIDNNVLTLTVDHEEKKEEEHTADPKKQDSITWHRSERSRVYVKRSVALPEAADTAAGKASYENGVLTIHFPKKALAAPPTKLQIT